MQFLVKAWGGDIHSRYVDIIKPRKQDNRTGDEIAAEIIKRHGLKVVG